VIWINAETKSDIINSFLKLTRLLDISIKNRFGNDKSIDELLPEIYHYFTDKKSLFIFDNVENYREFDEFLPGKQIGNTPTLLITSRFSHWRNILPVLTLDVFTDQEAIEFVKNELAIHTDEHDEKIKELITDKNKIISTKKIKDFTYTIDYSGINVEINGFEDLYLHQLVIMMKKN
jgi:hypothetical protein